MNRFQTWLTGEIRRVGWSELLRRAKGRFTAGALQAWTRGSFPGPTYQIVLAEITGATVETIKDLVWQSEMAREGSRLGRPFADAVPVARTAGPPRKPPHRVAPRSARTPKGSTAIVSRSA